MNRKNITLTVSIIFFIVILVFTVSARKIHNASLPKVTTGYLVYEEFAEKGEIPEWNVAIPKELYDNHKVYIISNEVVNGEERNIAKEVTNLVIGRSNDICYEVISGLSGLDQIIMTGQEAIHDGCEVYIED